MDEVLSAFLGECHENLEKLDNELVLLEKDPQGPHIQQSLAHIFRTVHTIKGSCGWLGLSKLESVVHDGEDLLVALREDQVPITTDVVSTLLEMFDAIREILYVIGATEQEGDKDYSELIQKLKDLQNPTGRLPHSEALETTEAAPFDEQSLDDEGETGTLKELIQPSEAQLSSTPQSGPAQSTAASNSTGTIQNAKVFNEYIRVDIRLLDKLMNLVGELVLTRNQLLQYTSESQDAAFTNTSQRLNLITSELQEGVMKTRMQTIGTVWKKFPRVVRDLALECHKQVAMQTEGETTELDRTIIEAIKDPLTHIVRNAIDHGIESPEERRAQGKNPEGKILFKAYHEGGQVNITISDDGRGIDTARLKEKAVQKGLISSSEALNMNERMALNLIFAPGFSTAEQVTHISGRGVGMDVVKSNIEEIGGSIELYSEVGQGSSFKIKIPLTLAIIPALMVCSGGEDFAIPQVSLLELVALSGEQANKAIEMIYNTPVYRLRGELLPLIYLNEELQLGKSFDAMLDLMRDHPEETSLNIVVLQADEQRFGLVVEEINDTEEIVVKALSKQLKNLSIYAGATILGDGRVALILDVMGFAQRVKVVSQAQGQKRLSQSQNDYNTLSETQSLLLFEVGGQRTMALPLPRVARLEEIDPARVELSGDLKVVQYRDQILPLIELADVLGQKRSSENAVLNVVVCSHHGNLAGLVVDRIVDIIESDENLEIQFSVRRPGVLGSAILQGQVTEILDFRQVITQVMPAFFDAPTEQQRLVGLI